MALDQLEHYHNVADAFREGAQLVAFFAALAQNDGDTVAVSQIGHYEDVCLQMAALYDELATGEPDNDEATPEEPDAAT